MCVSMTITLLAFRNWQKCLVFHRLTLPEQYGSVLDLENGSRSGVGMGIAQYMYTARSRDLNIMCNDIVQSLDITAWTTFKSRYAISQTCNNFNLFVT